MKKYIILFATALAYLLFSSKSCEGPEHEESLSDEEVHATSKNSIRHQFASDDLAPDLLLAMETKARQKLADFCDYLQVCADTALDTVFRNQARQMIPELFLSDTVQINSILTNPASGENLPLKDFLDTQPQNEFQSLHILIDSVNTVKSLIKTDKASYEGILAFQRQLTYRNAPDTANVWVKESMVAEMIVSKVNKALGTDTLQVWEVFLGNIR